jgi:hypothetical protein
MLGGQDNDVTADPKWRAPLGYRQVRQNPAPASTLGADEHVERERPMQQPAQYTRGARSVVSSTLATAKAGPLASPDSGSAPT